MDKPRTLPKPELTGNQTLALLLATILVSAIVLVVPTLYDELTGAEIPKRSYSAVVPKAGTIEYDAWMDAFEADKGHPYTNEDHRIAVQNGSHVMIGFIGIPIAFLFLISLILDTHHYRKCVKAFQDGEITDRPSRLAWLVRTAICLVCVIAFGGYLYGLVPHIVKPLP